MRLGCASALSRIAEWIPGQCQDWQHACLLFGVEHAAEQAKGDFEGVQRTGNLTQAPQLRPKSRGALNERHKLGCEAEPPKAIEFSPTLELKLRFAGALLQHGPQWASQPLDLCFCWMPKS